MSRDRTAVTRRRKVPRGTFWLGALTGAALGLPLAALVAGQLARGLHIGDPETGIDRILIIAGIFAGLPAVLTAGGVARLVAHRIAERPALRVRDGMKLAAWAMGAAGAGLQVLVAVPLGELPESRLRWLPIVVLGALAGVVTGAAIGLLTAMRQKRYELAEPEVAS